MNPGPIAVLALFVLIFALAIMFAVAIGGLVAQLLAGLPA